MMGKQAILGLMRRKSELILAQEKARAARPRCLFLVLLLFVVIVIFILIVIGIQGIVGGEEEVTQTHRDRVAAQLAGLAFSERVDGVARGEIGLELVGVLQELDRQVEHLRVGEGQVIAGGVQLVLTIGMR